MTWRDRQLFYPNGEVVRDYQRARFKDAPFWVRGYGFKNHRRQAIQRFPGSVYTRVQDLGENSATYDVQAFLLGPNYDSERDWLMGRLLEGGEGELRLPWTDPLKVTVVGDVQIDESISARGMASIRFSCIETSEPPVYPTKDQSMRMRQAMEAARGSTRRRFADRFEFTGLTGTRRGQISAALSKTTKRVLEVQKRVDAFMGAIPQVSRSVYRLSGALTGLAGAPLDLSNAIVQAVRLAYYSLRGPATAALDSVDTWARGGPLRVLQAQVFSFNGDVTAVQVDASTPDGEQTQQSIDEINRHFRLAMFYEMADLMPDLYFDSHEAAVALRDDFIEQIDPLLLEATPEEFETMTNFVDAVGAFLEDVAASKPELGTYTPAQVMPALLIAQTIYGNARYADDLIARNSIRHPGFVEADEPLEVLRVE